jgi:hypothetical protein
MPTKGKERTMSVLRWQNGWLKVTHEKADDQGILLWPVSAEHGWVGSTSLAQLGGRWVERRPDRMDCADLPKGLLKLLLLDQPDARIARIPIPRIEGAAEVMVVEGHDALFYQGNRLPIAPRIAGHLPDWTILCDQHRGNPKWMMMWRCPCGGYVVLQAGPGRKAEYFTETITSKGEDINETIELPDEFLAQTCVSCGKISITKDEATMIAKWRDEQRER